MHTNTESSYPDKSNIHIKQIRVNATESFLIKTVYYICTEKLMMQLVLLELASNTQISFTNHGSNCSVLHMLFVGYLD